MYAKKSYIQPDTLTTQNKSSVPAQNAVQQKSILASRFLKPNQSNMFQQNNDILQRKQMQEALAKLDSQDEKQRFDKLGSQKSDDSTHARHMKAGGKIKNMTSFTESRRSDVSETMQEQAKNRIQRDIDDIEKKIDDPMTKEKKKNELAIQLKSNNTGLPNNIKSGIENMSGISLNDVKVHYNSSKPAQLQAHAYTQGTEIHVAPGKEKYIGHEAWHVVQQKQGRVKPTMQMHGVSINDNNALEHEADVMGEKAAVQGKFNNAPLQMKFVGNGCVQRVICSRAMCEAEKNSIKETGLFSVRGNKSSKWCTIGATPNIKGSGPKLEYIIKFDIPQATFNKYPLQYDKINDRPIESDHGDHFIGKVNEPGNFGIGYNLLRNIQVKPFDWTTRTKINTKASKIWTNVK